jgi:uncharacterized protein YqgC (DUF456 family)
MIYVQNEVMHVYQINTFVLLVVIIRVFFAGIIIRFTNVLPSVQMINANISIIKISANCKSSDSSLFWLGVLTNKQKLSCAV